MIQILPATFAVTKMAFSGKEPKFLIFFKKSPLSLTYDRPLCITGLR